MNLRLDTQADADVIAWLERYRSGERSNALREAIRLGLGLVHPVDSALDLEAIRQVIAEELSKSLTGIRLQTQSHHGPDSQNDIEAQYGSKLDQMLGGLSQNSE